MALNRFQENGTTYFQLYVACPVCFEQGRNTPRSFREHGNDNCGGDVYIGDNACLKCIKCQKSSHVKNCKFSCNVCHDGSDSKDSFVNFDCQEDDFADAISITGQMVQECGQQWLMQFLANLGEVGKAEELQGQETHCENLHDIGKAGNEKELQGQETQESLDNSTKISDVEASQKQMETARSNHGNIE